MIDGLKTVLVKTNDDSQQRRSLESLKSYYEYKFVEPKTANEAIAERLRIIMDCDLKGYHTEEDMAMIEYLWKVRNTVVNQIIHQQTENEHNRRMIDDPYYRLQYSRDNEIHY